MQQGDFLHGDANGVTNVPVEIATEVADAAGEFCAAEKILLDYAFAGARKTLDGLIAARGEFTDAMANLFRRVRRG